MVRLATLADFQRHIDEIIHQGERDARNQIQDMQLYATQHGTPRSNRPLISSFEELDRVHSSAIERMHALVKRHRKMDSLIEVEALIPTIRSRMSQFQEGLLSMAAGVGLAQDHTRYFNQYASIFRQRLENAIKDIEIGFFEETERNPQQMKDSARRFNILQGLYKTRYEEDWRPLPLNLKASNPERRAEVAICRQLRNARLIDFKQPVEDSIEGVVRITELGVDVIEGNAKPLIAIERPTENRIFHNFAPGANFSNFQFAPDGDWTDASQAPDNEDDTIENESNFAAEDDKALIAEKTDDPARDRTIMLDRLGFLSKLEEVEIGLREIKPLVDLYSKNRSEHGAIGHNGPPEPIEPSPLSLDDYERALEATAALREEVSLEKPKASILRLAQSVLRDTGEKIKSLAAWAAIKFAEGALLYLGEEYAKSQNASSLIPQLEKNLSELVMQASHLLHLLTS